MTRLKNRIEAGKMLADALKNYASEPELIVLALPRGGVPVAFPVAQKFKAPFDVFLVRKLGVPGHEELAMGAVSSNGSRVLNQEVVDVLQIPEGLIDLVAQREMEEIKRRENVYRKGRPPLNLAGKTVILIDDGLATGSTMLASLKAIRTQCPRKIIAAVPVSPPSTCEQLQDDADAMICLITPEPFYGVGMWYDDFSQTEDREVVDLLDRAKAWTKGTADSINSNEARGRSKFPTDELHSTQ